MSHKFVSMQQNPRWHFGLTHRATLGGALTARELAFRECGSSWGVFGWTAALFEILNRPA